IQAVAIDVVNDRGLRNAEDHSMHLHFDSLAVHHWKMSSGVSGVPSPDVVGDQVPVVIVHKCYSVAVDERNLSHVDLLSRAYAEVLFRAYDECVSASDARPHCRHWIGWSLGGSVRRVLSSSV